GHQRKQTLILFNFIRWIVLVKNQFKLTMSSNICLFIYHVSIAAVCKFDLSNQLAEHGGIHYCNQNSANFTIAGSNRCYQGDDNSTVYLADYWFGYGRLSIDSLFKVFAFT